MKQEGKVIEMANLTKKQEEAFNVLYELFQSKNPKLDRLRRCPESGVFYYTYHRGKDFLNDKMEEDYRNRHQKLLKPSPAKDIQKLLVQEGIPVQLEKGGLLQSNDVEVSTGVVTPTHAVTTKPWEFFQIKDESIRKKSREFLQRLLGLKDALLLSLSNFDSPDFNIYAFDEVRNFSNSEIQFAIYDECILCWRETEKVILTHLKNMLWAL